MSTIPQKEEDDEKFDKIKAGFRVNHMQMKDGDNGKLMWEVKSWDLNKKFSNACFRKNTKCF